MEGVPRQILYMLVIALGHISMGTIIAFPSVLISDVEENGSNMYGGKLELSAYQKDMIGSITGLGSIVATITQSFTSRYFGKKVHLLLSGFICVVSWIGVACFPFGWGILVSRFLAGIFVGFLMIMGANYCVEICDSNLRGVFVGLLRVFILLGMLSTTILDAWLRYYTVGILSGIIPLAFVIGLLFIPESPRYLVIQGKDESALKILSRLRSKETNVEKEIENYKALNVERESKSVLQGLLNASVVKKILIISTLIFIRTFGGFEIMASYYGRIFKEFRTNLDVRVASIVLFAVQIPSTLIFTFFVVDRFGRKKALLVSCVVISLTLIYLSAHSYFLSHLVNENGEIVEIFNTTVNISTSGFDIETYNVEDTANSAIWWSYLPLISVLICLSAFYMGLHVVPFILMAEYFPTWIRGEATAICGSVFFLAQCGVFQLYTPMVYAFTTPGYYLFMAVLVALGVPFTYVAVTETIGKDIG